MGQATRRARRIRGVKSPLRIRQKETKKIKKIICTIFITILTILPSTAEASGFDDDFTGDFFHIMVNGAYEDTAPLETAPNQNDNDYYCYDEDFDEIILVNNNLEDDQNSDRDYLLKNQANLSELDKMYLDYLNAKALDYTYYTLNLLMTNIIKLDEMMGKVPPNNKELDLQREFYLNRLRWELNEAEKCPPIG